MCLLVLQPTIWPLAHTNLICQHSIDETESANRKYAKATVYILDTILYFNPPRLYISISTPMLSLRTFLSFIH